MNAGYLLLGVALLLVAVVDVLWTTLWVEGGAGPLTAALMAGSWWAIKRLGAVHSSVYTLAGPVILVISLATWIVLLWVGWTFVYAASEVALVDTVDGSPVTWADRFYVAGYSLFSLGNGDFAPTTGVWQTVTVLVTASGLSFITLGVTYLLSVQDAVTQKRSFATGVSGLGSRGDEFVRTAWDGTSFEGLDLQLNAYVEQLNTLTSNHKAYPILHYFHSQQSQQAPVTSIAVLDEALLILRFGVAESARPSRAILENARSSVDGYIRTLRGTFVRPADRTPPSPDLDRIRDAGIPTETDAAFADAVAERADRRRTLLGLVESDAREWPSEPDE